MQPSDHQNKTKEFFWSVVRRLNSPIPVVVMQSLTLVDELVYNCGKTFQLEVCSREFESELRRLVVSNIPNVAERSRGLIKKWAKDFKNDPQLGLMPALYSKLKSEGVSFKSTEPKRARQSETAFKNADVVSSVQEEADILKAIELSLRESGEGGGGASTKANSSYPSLNNNNKQPSQNGTSSSTFNLPDLSASKSSSSQPPAEEPLKVRALYDFEADEDNELTFKSGELILVLDKSDANWWKGSNHRGEGLFPANFVTTDLTAEPEPIYKSEKKVQFNEEIKVKVLKENEHFETNGNTPTVIEVDESRIDQLPLLHEADPLSAKLSFNIMLFHVTKITKDKRNDQIKLKQKIIPKQNAEKAKEFVHRNSNAKVKVENNKEAKKSKEAKTKKKAKSIPLAVLKKALAIKTKSKAKQKSKSKQKTMVEKIKEAIKVGKEIVKENRQINPKEGKETLDSKFGSKLFQGPNKTFKGLEEGVNITAVPASISNLIAPLDAIFDYSNRKIRSSSSDVLQVPSMHKLIKMPPPFNKPELSICKNVSSVPSSSSPGRSESSDRCLSHVNSRREKSFLQGSRKGDAQSSTRSRGNFHGGYDWNGAGGSGGPRNIQRQTTRSQSPVNRRSRSFQLRRSRRGNARSPTRGRGNFQGRSGRCWNSGGGPRNYQRQTSRGLPRSRSPVNCRSRSFQLRRSRRGKAPRSNSQSPHRRHSQGSGPKRKLPGRAYYRSLSCAQSGSQSFSQSPSDQPQPQRDNALTPLKKELAVDKDFQTKTLDEAWELLSRKYKVQLAAVDDQINKDLADATSTNVKNVTGGDGAPAVSGQITMGKQWVDKAASLYYPQNREPARKAVALLNSAMNALPPLSSVTNKAEKKKLNDAYAIIHYQRARAFFMLNQKANFELDARETLRLSSDPSVKIEMVECLLSATTNRVKKLFKGCRSCMSSSEDKRMLTQACELALQIQDLMLHYACMTANAAEDLDKLKSFRLRNMYDWAKDNISIAMDKINSSSKTDSSGAKADSSPKNGAKAAGKPANAARRLTNVLDNVSVDPFAYKLMTKKDFYKDRVIFYESMLAFLPNRNTPEAVGHCGNCFREAGVGRLHPCSVCTNVQFCTSGCERVANYISTDGKLYGRHKYACQFGPQLYKRVGKCAALVYQLLSYTSLPHLMLCEASKYDFEQFLKGTQANPTKNIWQSFAVATLMVRRYKELLGTNDAKKLLTNNVGRIILAEAYYLMKVAEAKLRPYGDMNKKNAKNNEKNDKKDKDQKKGKDENKEKAEYQVILFKMVYYLLWFVHHHPQAHDQIGKFVQKQQTNSTRSGTPKKSVKISNHARKFIRCGYGFGAFGGLLQQNCEPNVDRRFNTFTGNIEYVAKLYLPAKTELTIDWGLRPTTHYPKGSVRRKQTILRRFGISCNCPKCAAQYQGVQTLSYHPQWLLTEQARIGGNHKANANFSSASSPFYRGF